MGTGPASYALLLRTPEATNDAIVARSDGLDVPFTERDQELLSPSQREYDRREIEGIARAGGMEP